ncbi:MAG: response regulator transcription factor, partial [Bacillota bacterium]|nr:response regulator transcription factor [Bacillota bacterium]
VDITMPGLNGLELIRLLRQRYPRLAVIVLTIHDQSEYFLEAVKAGAQGYVLKDVDPSGIGEAIRAVARGETFYPERFLPRLAAEYRRLAADEGAGAPRGGAFPYGLTQRERQILVCLASGMTNARIASTLSISEKTVKNHLTNLFRKLGVEDRTQAVLLAVKERLVEVE